jgi:outer membrane receptor protein involved in Fe transport
LNQGTTRTKGLELVYQRSFNQAELSLAYSHYQADNTSTLAALPRRFPDDLVIDDTEHITYAPDKFSASMSYKFTDNISLNPSLLWLSRRWTYTQPLVSTGVGTLVELPSVTLVDLALDWRNAGVSGLDVNLTLHNALDEQHNFYQPFRSSASYLPDMGREWVLGVRYRF